MEFSTYDILHFHWRYFLSKQKHVIKRHLPSLCMPSLLKSWLPSGDATEELLSGVATMVLPPLEPAGGDILGWGWYAVDHWSRIPLMSSMLSSGRKVSRLWGGCCCCWGGGLLLLFSFWSLAAGKMKYVGKWCDESRYYLRRSCLIGECVEG